MKKAAKGGDVVVSRPRSRCQPVHDDGFGVSVMIAEDDVATCITLGSMICCRFPSLTVKTVGDGRKGVELFTEDLPDIVITDINMPVMNGLEMASRIKSISDRTRIIVLSGCKDEEHLEKLEEIGVDHYLAKPYAVQELFSAIETCISKVARRRGGGRRKSDRSRVALS